jgi:DNA invertase Pin-like site-specific DNA recombinase
VALQILSLGIDTGTATGKLVLTMLGGIADFERSIMLERQREGISKAQREGKYAKTGRKNVTRDQKAEQVKALHAEGVGPAEIARKLSMGRTSVYRALGMVEWAPTKHKGKATESATG